MHVQHVNFGTPTTRVGITMFKAFESLIRGGSQLDMLTEDSMQMVFVPLMARMK